MPRPNVVEVVNGDTQPESEPESHWYRVRSGQNGSNVLTSETYATHSNAMRAARAYIRSIAPAPVVFVYCRGRFGNRERVVENIR